MGKLKQFNLKTSVWELKQQRVMYMNVELSPPSEDLALPSSCGNFFSCAAVNEAGWFLLVYNVRGSVLQPHGPPECKLSTSRKLFLCNWTPWEQLVATEACAEDSGSLGTTENERPLYSLTLLFMCRPQTWEDLKTADLWNMINTYDHIVWAVSRLIDQKLVLLRVHSLLDQFEFS